MTRDETNASIAYLQADLDSIKRGIQQLDSDRDVVNTKLEMLRISLKPIEPKSVEGLQEKISRTLCSAGFGYRERSNIYRSLAATGLKIVEK